MGWIDISMPLNETTAVWPGDTRFLFSLNWSKQHTGSVNVGKIEMSTHTGTHIDAPYHFDDSGKKIHDYNLERFIGNALVVSLETKKSICIDDVVDIDTQGVEKLLLKTNAWKDRSIFPDSIPCIEPGVAECLARKGIKLLGLDLPSVDPIDSKELVAHHELASQDILILEGLVLKDVNPGHYEMVAVPLSIKGGDASPVRAIIRPL
ncbi:arylformamidase [Bacillus salitolerans]|uniref:Kynurenine formamidase n=1 Tax=Bacillus salitolerans TaxID=1437434 RepID=A0ABW4LKC0_9BACI